MIQLASATPATLNEICRQRAGGRRNKKGPERACEGRDAGRCAHQEPRLRRKDAWQRDLERLHERLGRRADDHAHSGGEQAQQGAAHEVLPSCAEADEHRGTREKKRCGVRRRESCGRLAVGSWLICPIRLRTAALLTPGGFLFSGILGLLGGREDGVLLHDISGNSKEHACKGGKMGPSGRSEQSMLQ
jgi:hypothetical protein